MRKSNSNSSAIYSIILLIVFHKNIPVQMPLPVWSPSLSNIPITSRAFKISDAQLTTTPEQFHGNVWAWESGFPSG